MSQGNPLIDRLLIVFGEPEKTDDVAAFIGEYRRLTDRYGETVLNKAADHLIRNGGRVWPTPKACVDACNEAAEATALREAASPHRQPKKLMPWDHDLAKSKEWAREYCQLTPLGRQAFDECWGRSLYDYVQSYARECFRHGRDPGRMIDYRPPQDVLDYYSRFGRDAPNIAAVDRSLLLGEPMPEPSDLANKSHADIVKGNKQALNLGGLFKSPLPPAVSEEQFQIDQETGAQ